MKDCTRHREEIASAAGDALTGEVREHVESCPSCQAARLRALALARVAAENAPAYSIVHAEAVARRARARTRRTFIWAAPLISASATAAGLILFFGIALSPAAPGEHPAQAAPADDALEQAYEQAGSFKLPDPLRVVHEIMSSGTYEEKDQ